MFARLRTLPRRFIAGRFWWIAVVVAFLLPIAALVLLVGSAPITPAFAYTLR